MDLNPQLPPLPTLTLLSTPQNDLPDKPADPHISVLFPENTPYRAPNNPYRGAITWELKKKREEAIQEALLSIKAPFHFESEGQLKFDGTKVGTDLSMESFNDAVITVIAAIERGYHSTRDPTPLGPNDWARLSCAILAAVGRGYHRQYSTEHESQLEKVRAGVIDPNPLSKDHPTLFHRLAVIAGDISRHVDVDQEGYQDWYLTMKNDFMKQAAKAANADVDEKWLLWRAAQIDKLASDNRRSMASQAKENATPTPFLNRKRTVSGSPSSGSTPRAKPPPTLANNVMRTQHNPSPLGTPTGPRTILTLSPKVTLNLGVRTPPPKPSPDSQPDAAALTASILNKILTRLDSLEKLSRPQPVRQTDPRSKQAPKPVTLREQADTPYSNGDSPRTVQPETREEEDFTLVGRNGRKKKGKGKVPPPQTNPPPLSYASKAAASAGIKQPPPPAKVATHLPAITEITVIRTGAGGHPDEQIEHSIQIRPADAIVREVRLKMGNVVSNPIPLRAGRWSIQPRSRGNFVYSFDGNISFDLIKSYETILLTPFHGTGKLSPSMGWTRLLAHGVPLYDDDYQPFGPEMLLKEARAMPGLKKAHFAMPPRWLKHPDRMEGYYSTVTFAISDPDGSITSNLLNGRAAMFGKEVIVQRWVDKPALVQCSRCHALGHIKTSRACPLGKDSAKCYKCGGSHVSEMHDQKCNRRHAVAGICDCSHFKCLNCHKTGHNCKDKRCPARDLYRPRTNRKRGKQKQTSQIEEWDPEMEPNNAPPIPPTEDHVDSDEDLYAPLAPSRKRMGHQERAERTARHHRAIDNMCGPSSYSLVDDRDDGDTGMDNDWMRAGYDSDEFPEAFNRPVTMDTDPAAAGPRNYSPSLAQGGATQPNHA